VVVGAVTAVGVVVTIVLNDGSVDFDKSTDAAESKVTCQ
jgi:hypothetical protein